MVRRVVQLGSLLSLLLLVAQPVRGATILLGPGQSIQNALDAAVPGDEVVLLDGTYHQTVSLVDGVDLRAQNPGAVTIDAEGEGTVVTAIQVGSSTLVQGLTFRNGSASQGGGLFAIGSTLTFQNCTFENNAAGIGGGASLTQGSTILFDTCTFTRNAASVGGGIHLDFSAATLQHGFVSWNEASSDGAGLAILNASEALIEDVCLYSNRTVEGATISIVYSSPTLRNCTITANLDDAAAGAVALHGSGARIERCIIAFNQGPALSCIDSDFAWVGCNDLFGNLDDTLCGADQGNNLSVDPLFCNPSQAGYNLQANSPLLGLPCGSMGAHMTSCPAFSAVEFRTWSHIKREYRD